MILDASTLAIGNALTSSFLASGGTGPYSYSVAPDGVGGAINSSTGVYTAPSTGTGVDTVIATDSIGDTATAEILVGSSLELFCDIIRTEMGLESDQVFLWDQKFTIPNDSRVYVAVSILSCKVFGTKLTLDNQSVSMKAILGVDIMSRNFDAVTRKEEVVMALSSHYSESQQELNSFYIASQPSAFTNLSQEDGAAIPYRFNLTIAIQYSVSKVKAAPYYDTFDTVEVTTED